MRIAIISDIHANLPALEAVWRDIQENFLDSNYEIWFLGDLFGYGPFAPQVYTKLVHSVRPKIWLAGNHDLAISGELFYLKKMNNVARCIAKIHAETIPQVYLDGVIHKPEQRLLMDIAGWRVHLAHGIPYQNNHRRKPGEVLRRFLQQIIRLPGDMTLEHLQVQNRRTSINTYDFEFAPFGENKPLLQAARALSNNTQVWIVGHSHRQTGWYYQDTTQTWRLLIDDFGQSLSGKVRTWQGATLPENRKFQVEHARLQPGDFMILNPGSVGFPRDGCCSFADPPHLAKYLLLNFTEQHLCGEYRWVPYTGKSLLDTWEKTPRYPVEVQNMITY